MGATGIICPSGLFFCNPSIRREKPLREFSRYFAVLFGSWHFIVDGFFPQPNIELGVDVLLICHAESLLFSGLFIQPRRELLDIGEVVLFVEPFIVCVLGLTAASAAELIERGVVQCRGVLLGFELKHRHGPCGAKYRPAAKCPGGKRR